MSFVAWHTLSNVYHLSPPGGGGWTPALPGGPHAVHGGGTVDTGAFHHAASLPLSDFEDALPVAAAHACGATRIVTRDVRDFRRSPIPAHPSSPSVVGGKHLSCPQIDHEPMTSRSRGRLWVIIHPK